MFSLRNVYILFVLGVVLTATVASGQVGTGSISGNVADTTGAVISGAMVQVQNVGTGLSRSVQTDVSGHYEARDLPLGSYSITAQQTGFNTEVRSGITLTVGSDVVVNLELSVGSVQQTVTVTSEASAVETTNATLSGLVAEQQIRDLPLNGRSVDQLSVLTPGVQQIAYTASSALGGAGTQISINGQRGNANLYLLDGTTVNNHNDSGPGSALSVQLGVDSILEFRVLTHDYSAEYGHSSGGVVSYVTRSGTNDFHGSLYEFLRNNDLDARNYFNVTGSGAPTALPPFRQNQFGASFGGPVRKNRIFFFANYEGVRMAQGVTTTAFVPDNAARMGTLPSGPVTINPIMIPYINIFPKANGADLGNGTAEYIVNLNNTGAEDYVVGRADFILSDKDTLFARYLYDASTRVTPTAVAPFASGQTGTEDLAVLSETHIFSPTKLNVFSLAWNRTAPDATLESTAGIAFDPALDLVPGQGFGAIAFKSAAGLTGYGTVANGYQYLPQNLIQELDTLTLTHGRHTLKFGGDAERYQLETNSLPFQQGEYTFKTLAAFLTDKPSQLNLTVTGPNTSTSAFRLWRQSLFGAFVQDEFRLRKNLTLDFGIREEFVTTPNEINGRSAVLYPLTAAASTVGPPWESKHKLQPAPRFGLAWDPFGHGTTSIRLGAGLFYNENLGRIWYVESAAEYRFLQSYIVLNPPNFPNALQSGYAVTGAVSSISESTMPYKPPTQKTTQYNVGIEHQLTPTISIEAGYVGSYSLDLPIIESADLAIPTIEAGGVYFFAPNAPLANPNFSNISTIQYHGLGNYNALQLAVNKRFSRGLLLQVNYTFSKDLSTEDNIGGANFIMNPFRPQLDYGLSGLDQRHLFRVDGRYVLPFGDLVNSKWAKEIVGGWEINGIFTAASGNPVNIQTGFSQSNDGDPQSPDRPNLVPGFSNNPTSGTTGAGCAGVASNVKLGTPTLWFNPCAFSLPAPGFFGNLGRDTVIGPGEIVLNSTLARTFSITERVKLQLRGEFYNLFNRANFSSPGNSVLTSSGSYAPTAGIIMLTAIPNRQTQIALRLMF